MFRDAGRPRLLGTNLAAAFEGLVRIRLRPCKDTVKAGTKRARAPKDPGPMNPQLGDG